MAEMVKPLFGLAGITAGLVVTSLLPAATSASKPVDLRVVAPDGRTLVEQRQYTGSVGIETDPRARCFGQGTGGSGDRVKVRGATALGAVRDALAKDRDLRPLSITDAFLDDGFGLGVCGIGGFRAQGSSFWYLKGDHVGSQVSGSQLKVSRGEEVLWYLTPSFPPPPELRLRAPARARPNVPFQVTVYAYADDGTRTPAAGASVTGAAQPTGPTGRTTVSVKAGSRVLKATRGANIPSNRAEVCVRSSLSKCPDERGRLIYGSRRDDHIRGTGGRDEISAGGGADRVILLDRGRDRVRCGGGHDKVVLHRGDRDDRIGDSCERVVKR
jgi:hypothetical protein